MKRITQITIIMTALFLISCQSINNDGASPSNVQNDNLIHVKNSNPTERDQLTNSEIATHLSNIANQVKDVNDAAAVVAGPYAVVGIDLDKNLDRQRVGSIKYSVAEALRNDPYGKTAVVIADGDLMERFRQMGIEIQDGRPVRGVVEELAEIVNRYMPDVPVEEDRYDGKQQNDLPDQSEEDLKRIQEEQSEDNLQNK